jgi:hypothetical protein
MSKARDLANAGTALTTVSATELGYLDGVTSAVQTQLNAKQATVTNVDDTEIGYLDGVTSAIQTQLNAKEATLPSQTGNSGKYLTTNGTAKSWGTVSQYALPTQTGNSGKFLTTNGTAESWGTVSQPLTWTARHGTPTDTLYQVAYNGTNLYVAGGSSGIILTSPDGITWTSRTSNFGGNNIFSVAFGNGLFVAVGSGGTIATSPDGITWTARTSNMGTNQINHVIYANSIWVAVGRGGGTTNTGGITYSTDGITWTRKSQSLTVGSTYCMVSWNGTNFVVAANISTNNYLYASTPSGTWTAGADGSGASLNSIIWDGTRHIVCTSSSKPRYSTSTTLGTTTQINNINDLNSSGENEARAFNYYYNGRIYSSVTKANGGISSDWSTTPFQTNYVTTGTKYLSPGGVSSIDTRFLFIGTIGQIVFDGYMLYTSF